jgi:hypothetical protein
VTDWADELRDRLGLAHFEPGTAFILFSYRVGELCCISTDQQRHPLAVPTVVDHDLSSAFCPAPRNSNDGLSVDLAANGRLTPELIHPAVRLAARHVFRLGRITRPVPPDLNPARQAHLAALRETTGRMDYALDTDPPM